MQIARKHQLKVNSYYASLGGNTPDEFIAYYEKKGKEDQYQPLWNTYQKRRFSDDEQSKIISFLSEVALNSSMKELQEDRKSVV